MSLAESFIKKMGAHFPAHTSTYARILDAELRLQFVDERLKCLENYKRSMEQISDGRSVRFVLDNFENNYLIEKKILDSRLLEFKDRYSS